MVVSAAIARVSRANKWRAEVLPVRLVDRRGMETAVPMGRLPIKAIATTIAATAYMPKPVRHRRTQLSRATAAGYGGVGHWETRPLGQRGCR
eukprot:1439715-Prorocentrum_lima.AAC.1